MLFVGVWPCCGCLLLVFVAVWRCFFGVVHGRLLFVVLGCPRCCHCLFSVVDGCCVCLPFFVVGVVVDVCCCLFVFVCLLLLVVVRLLLFVCCFCL